MFVCVKNSENISVRVIFGSTEEQIYMLRNCGTIPLILIVDLASGEVLSGCADAVTGEVPKHLH